MDLESDSSILRRDLRHATYSSNLLNSETSLNCFKVPFIGGLQHLEECLIFEHSTSPTG